MKKVLKNLFVVFTAAALLGTFVSCGNGDENDDVLNVEKDYGSKTGEEPTKPDNPSETVDTPDDNKENQGGQNPAVSEEDFEEVEVTALAGKETSWGNENFLKVGTDYTSKLTAGSRIYFDVAKKGEYLKFHVDNGSWGNCGVTKYFKNDGSEVTKLDEDTDNKGVWNMEGEDGVYYVTVTSENIDKLKAGFGIHGNLVINKVTLKIKKDSNAVPVQEEGEAGTSVVKKIELIKNEYAENGALQTQVKIATGFESLAIGDKVKLTMKGSADKALGHAEMMVVDTTEAANWWKMLSEKNEVEIGITFEVSHEFTIEALPDGTGPNSMILAINGLDGDETVNLNCTEFKLEKVAGAESTEPAPQTDPESQEDEPGTTDSATVTIEINPNVYGEPLTNHGLQYTKTASDIFGDNLPKSGETYTLTLIGSSDVEFDGMMQFVNTAWGGITGEAATATFTAEKFNIEKDFTFSEDLPAAGMFQLFNTDTNSTKKVLTVERFLFTKQTGETPTEDTEPEEPQVPFSSNSLEANLVANPYAGEGKVGIQAKVIIRDGNALKGVKAGDVYTVVMKGTPSATMTPQVLFYDGTDNVWAGISAWGDNVEMTENTAFEVTKDITVTTAPSSDEAVAFQFMIDYARDGSEGDLAPATITFTEFSVTKKVTE